MSPVLSPTTGFTNALRYGAILTTARFTVYEKGVASGTPYTAAMSTGSFTVDRNSSQRRTGQITIELTPTVPLPILMPANPTSLLAPFGNEIFIEVGIATSNTVLENPGQVAETQWVPMGLFVIATSSVDDTVNDLVVTLNLYDRSWAIAQRKLLEPYDFPAADGNFVTEIQTLLNQVWKEQTGVAPLQYNIVPTDSVVPVASYNQGSDPWQACVDMATAVGYELYFDTNGIVVGKPIPDPLTQPITWNFTDDETAILGLGGTGSASLFGDAYSTPVEVQVQMTRDGVYNDIIIQGTGTANMAQYNNTTGTTTAPPPILAQAADRNPASPTYIGGGLGDVPNFISSSLVTDTGAQPMANSDLQIALSSSWTVTLQIPPMPILNVDDVVTITRPRVGLNKALVVLDTITHAVKYADTSMITGRILSNLSV